MSRRVLWLCALAFGGALTACVADHSALERRPDAGRAGSGAGGTSGASGGFAQIGGSSGAAATAGGHPDDEPPGTSKLTIVNGVVDAPSVIVCLSKLDDEGSPTPLGDPLGGVPLEYGRSMVPDVPTGVDLEQDALQPFLIAGDLQLVAGLDCETAIARARAEEGLPGEPVGAVGEGGTGGVLGGAAGETQAGASGSAEAGASGSAGAARSRLRVRGLPAMPAGTLSAGRSLLLVANGCLGGMTYTSSNAELYCGKGYSERQPTVSAVLVSLSRKVAFERVGMQVVHASLASGALDVHSRPPFPSSDTGFSIAGSLVPGQVAPRPASVLNSVLDYGIAQRHVLEVSDQASMPFVRSWEQALTLGSLDELKNGGTYALVISGPRGALPAIPELWNAAALTAVAADPG